MPLFRIFGWASYSSPSPVELDGRSLPTSWVSSSDHSLTSCSSSLLSVLLCPQSIARMQRFHSSVHAYLTSDARSHGPLLSALTSRGQRHGAFILYKICCKTSIPFVTSHFASFLLGSVVRVNFRQPSSSRRSEGFDSVPRPTINHVFNSSNP